MKFLKQITALFLALAVSFSKSHGTNEKLKSFLADNVLDNDTYDDWASIDHLNSLHRFVMDTFDDHKETVSRINDDISNLQHMVSYVPFGDKGSPCEWDKKEPECLPPDCSEAFKNESGTRKINPPGIKRTPFHVYCLKDDKSGDPWTVIQRRFKGEVNFNHKWHQYKLGFGSLDDEFWLGLDHIYTLTNSARYELRITLKNWDGTFYVAYYDNFLISDEKSNYALKGIGVHSGNASDSLKIYQSGAMWSTRDRDNDIADINCPDQYKSGWWYRHCAYSNLNGEIPKTKDEKFTKKGYGKGIFWGSIQKTTFKASEMAIRIKKSKRS